MSHIVTVETEVRDPAAVTAACRRLSLESPLQKKVRLFSSEVTGLVVQLPGWHYPVICQTQSGQVSFDNFEGRWGDRAELDRFLQAYAVEKAKLEARRQGHSVVEQALPNGSVKLTVQVGGQT